MAPAESGTAARAAPEAALAADPAERPTGSAARALRLLAAVLEHGPLRPQDLCDRTGMGRTAVHRAIHALIDEGFLRYQLGRRHVALQAAYRGKLAGGSDTPAELDAVVIVVEQVCRARRLQADIAMLTETAEFRLVEATDPDRLDQDEPALESDLFVAALTLLNPVDVLSTTTAVLKRERGDTRAADPAFLDRYRWARRNGALWDGHSHELCVPLGRWSGRTLALRLWAREGGPRSQGAFDAAVAEMRRAAPDLLDPGAPAA